MKGRILILIGLIAAAVLAGFFVKKASENQKIKEASVKDVSWLVLEEYLAAAKAHDLERIKRLSYQLSDTCRNETRREACEQLMDTAYFYGSLLKKEEMTHVLYDDRQIILHGDYTTNLNGPTPSTLRPIIYFIRDGETIKILSFDPEKGSVIIRRDQATSTIETRLREMSIDTDRDTLPDEAEKCVGADAVESCVKTNPNKKDTDNDGFWDSVEALFYKRAAEST